jgi:hypothetical protein
MDTNPSDENSSVQRLLKSVNLVEEQRREELKEVVDALVDASPSHVIIAWLNEEGQSTNVRILDPIDGGLETLGLARMVEHAAMEYLFGGGKQRQQLEEKDEDE